MCRKSAFGPGNPTLPLSVRRVARLSVRSPLQIIARPVCLRLRRVRVIPSCPEPAPSSAWPIPITKMPRPNWLRRLSGARAYRVRPARIRLRSLKCVNNGRKRPGYAALRGRVSDRRKRLSCLPSLQISPSQPQAKGWPKALPKMALSQNRDAGLAFAARLCCRLRGVPFSWRAVKRAS
jgi:hypothetical protein